MQRWRTLCSNWKYTEKNIPAEMESEDITDVFEIKMNAEEDKKKKEKG